MFNQQKFNKWEEETHIPKKIMDMVEWICEKCGVCLIEETITLRNRGGYAYAFAKGYQYSYCTSSYEDGPDVDYSDEIAKWLKGLGFIIENSYGDNGLDSATNWHDTFGHYDFVYQPTKVYAEIFEEYSDDDDDYE